MGLFIQNNSLWFIPIFSVFFTIIIKISAKSKPLDLSDFFDFGFDLATSSMIVLLINIKDNTGIWILFLSFALIMVVCNIVNRLGWKINSICKNYIGIIIPDIFGILILMAVMLYIGGIFK